MTATEIAKKVEAHDEELLYRFLRTLAALGILRVSVVCLSFFYAFFFIFNVLVGK